MRTCLCQLPLKGLKMCCYRTLVVPFMLVREFPLVRAHPLRQWPFTPGGRLWAVSVPREGKLPAALRSGLSSISLLAVIRPALRNLLGRTSIYLRSNGSPRISPGKTLEQGRKATFARRSQAPMSRLFFVVYPVLMHKVPKNAEFADDEPIFETAIRGWPTAASRLRRAPLIP